MSGPPERRLPSVHARRREEHGQGRVVEHVDLEFANGERRVFQRVLAEGTGAVAVVPLIDEQSVLLVREYAAGTHRYEIGLVKGRIDPGEPVIAAADRELKEEAGYGARQLIHLRDLSLSPSYMQHAMAVVVARDLYAERLPGDEPELPEVLPWRLDALHELMLREDCSDGRSLAALFIVREWLAHAA